MFTAPAEEAAYLRVLARAKEWFPQTGDPWGCLEVIDRVKVWLREQGDVRVADRYTLALEAGPRLDPE